VFHVYCKEIIYDFFLLVWILIEVIHFNELWFFTQNTLRPQNISHKYPLYPKLNIYLFTFEISVGF